MDWRRRRIPVVRQVTETDCAAACLTMVLAHHGKTLRLDDVRQLLGIGRDGADALSVVKGARFHGLRARGVKIENVADLRFLQPGTMLHWGFHHYVLFEELKGDSVAVARGDQRGAGDRRAPRVDGADRTRLAGEVLADVGERHDAPAAAGVDDVHVKSTSVTNVEGSADVALPGGVSCAIYALPKEGSFAVVPVVEPLEGAKPLLIRVPEGASSLRLALKSEAGEPFSAMSLLMRIDGVVVPPAVARLLSSHGFALMTNEEGSVSLQRIPRGIYDFWPYRNSAEGQMLYETATDFEAPISVKVLTGENNATVRFRAR